MIYAIFVTKMLNATDAEKHKSFVCVLNLTIMRVWLLILCFYSDRYAARGTTEKT